MLVDTVPVSTVADASVVAAAADGVILVVDLERVRRRELLTAKRQLTNARAQDLGIVVNRASVDFPVYYVAEEEVTPERGAGRARRRVGRAAAVEAGPGSGRRLAAPLSERRDETSPTTIASASAAMRERAGGGRRAVGGRSARGRTPAQTAAVATSTQAMPPGRRASQNGGRGVGLGIVGLDAAQPPRSPTRPRARRRGSPPPRRTGSATSARAWRRRGRPLTQRPTNATPAR